MPWTVQGEGCPLAARAEQRREGCFEVVLRAVVGCVDFNTPWGGMVNRRLLDSVLLLMSRGKGDEGGNELYIFLDGVWGHYWLVDRGVAMSAWDRSG